MTSRLWFQFTHGLSIRVKICRCDTIPELKVFDIVGEEDARG
jgi:hypothetical protein